MYEKLIFVTHNQNKLAEIKELLGKEFKLVSLEDLCIDDDIPETRTTLEGNAIQKARYIYDRFHLPCFADDSGLETESLNGEPGVYSARYAGSLSEFESENIRNEANIQKLLYNLSGKTNRRARFRTVIGFITDNHEYTFEGIVNGQIVSQKRGKSGFGYDPVFVPDGFDITFAEMTLKEKNKISHRARAFRKFAEFLKNSKK
jgi:XTP/dITP diphosphohydrolase